jgi:hypothetical protein
MPYIVIVHATFNNKSDADHIHNQALSVATNASVAHIGDEMERTSHGYVAEEGPDGEHIIDRSWHVDLFGIVREGEPDLRNAPDWIQPSGTQNAYPGTNVRGGETLVTHNDQVWRNVHGNGNTWEPGVFGWELVE